MEQKGIEEQNTLSFNRLKHKRLKLFTAGVFVLLIFCGRSVSGQNNPAKVEIKGVVTDAKTGEFLVGASIFIKETSKGIVSGKDGSYTLLLDKGNYVICGAFVGYQTKEFNVVINKSQILDIHLEPNIQELESVVVSGRDKSENVTSVNMGVERMSIKEIQRLPVLMGEVDVLKAIQLLPGVQATAEGGSGFSVRGGSPDQNLILLDNTTVYNASHLLGFFSVFNNDVVSGLELFKGDLPLKYGGRLSSLLSVDTKSDIPQQFQGTGGVGLISARLMLEGNAGDRTSWLIGGRRSYADIFLAFAKEEALRKSSVYFYDMNAKISHRFSPKDKIELSGYYGKDMFSAEVGQFDYGNAAASLIWRHSFSGKWFSRISLNTSNYGYGLGSDMEDMEANWEAGIFDLVFTADFDTHISKLWNLNYGISTTLHRFSPGHVSVNGYPDYEVQGSRALEHGVYLSNEQKLTNRLSLRYGLRWSVFQNFGATTIFGYNDNHEVRDSTYYSGGIYNAYGRLEPRIGGVYLINGSSSVKANYARNVQFIQLAENSSAGSPINVWFPASPNIRPQTVDMISAGYFRNFKNNMYETSVEVYYKDLNGVIDFAEHADLLLNQYLEGDVRTGTGRAYGSEFMIKKNSGKLTGFVNYTLSRSERTIPEINKGKTYLAPYDKTHAVNIAVNYDFSKKINVSATWVFASGVPTTYPTGRFEISGEYFPVYSGRNEYHKPAYHRLDLSLNYIPKPDSKKRWKGEWNLSIYNAYGRKNPWLITYSQVKTATPTSDMVYLFRFVPSITYNFKF
ncbi:MAG: TonB-dependent receptor [Prevotellaceae bacterium]|nr:TonB-dependent receptor [Prevotellaceae bacterium]